MGRGQTTNTPKKPLKKKQIKKAKNKRQNLSRTLRKSLAKLEKKGKELIDNPPEPDQEVLVMRATKDGLKLVPAQEALKKDHRAGWVAAGRRRARTVAKGYSKWRAFGHK